MRFLRRFPLFILLFSISTLAFSQRRVACIGDSVTKGYLVKGKSYPTQLQELLGKDFRVENFGFSGSTLLSKGHRPYIKTEEYQKALLFKADIIVIALGLNDTDPRNWPNYSNEFQADYSSLISDFRKINPKVEVYICKMTPIFSGHSRFLSGTRDWFDQIQQIIPKIAKANQAKLIDNHSPLSARIDLFEDYLHPNEQGAGIIANTVFKALKPIVQPLSFSASLGSNMVLQRNTENKISGSGAAFESLELTFNAKKLQTTVDSLGNWSIILPPMKAGGPYDLNIKGKNGEIILKNLLFGDVFLASGQSNMAFMLKQAANNSKLIKNASQNSNIRLFKNKSLAETNNIAWGSLTLKKVNDLAYFSGQWEVPNEQNAADFSAIAYAFANEIAQSEQVPIGIIDLSVGGSNTESWIPRQALEDDNLLAPYIHQWRTSDFIQDFCRERGNQNLKLSTIKNQRHPYDPSYNFEAGVSKWMNTKVKAVLWYQGESNAHNVELHDHLFQKLVSSWRNSFQQNLPFYFVQLSSINRPSWPVFRDHQRLLTHQIAKTYMAVSSDLGDPNDVHPKEKITIGERLANLVKQHEYAKRIHADTPEPLKVHKKDQNLIIVFSNADQLRTKNNQDLKGLQLFSDRGYFVEVNNAKIEKNKLIIPLPKQKISKIMYAYQAYTNANLENEANTPVSTFSINID